VGGRPVHYLTLVDPHLGAEEYVSSRKCQDQLIQMQIEI
jgi:hypothetical protein